jgi:hypothetical protein
MHTDIRSRRASNEAFPCRHPSCHRSRASLSPYCRPHFERTKHLGHPDAVAYRSGLWAPHRAEVERLLESNPDHPGLLQVINFVDRLLTQAAGNVYAFKGADELCRLLGHGVTARQIVVEACAHWLWTSDMPKAFPSDTAADFALARAVFALAPRPRRPCGVQRGGRWSSSYARKPNSASLRFIGQHLRKSLAAFLVNVTHAVHQARTLRKDPEALMRLPFQVTYR